MVERYPTDTLEKDQRFEERIVGSFASSCFAHRGILVKADALDFQGDTYVHSVFRGKI